MGTRFTITHGTEHKIWTSIGGEKACFTIKSRANGGPGRVRFRRTRAGKIKDLDYHIGHKCWHSKFPIYVLYATAVDEDVDVIRHDPTGVGIPGTPPRGDFIRPTSLESEDVEGGELIEYELTAEEVELFLDDDGEEPDPAEK